tara:strand:+ start:627 stop:1130 length:504 start_codon:yes stop_codon:yes gene_type:complete
MIDLGITQIALIGAVALVVVGPEKLPGVAKMAGKLFGRAQRYINGVKEEVNREMQMDEIKKMQNSIVSAAKELNNSVSKEIEDAEQDFSEAISEANNAFSAINKHSTITDKDNIYEKARGFQKKKISFNQNLQILHKRQNIKKYLLSGAGRFSRFKHGGVKSSNFFK